MQHPMGISRRDCLLLFGTGAATLGAGHAGFGRENTALESEAAQVAAQEPPESAAVLADRARRLKWWQAARFGMFVHWGLYSVVGRHEWVMEMEGIAVREYELLAGPVPASR